MRRVKKSDDGETFLVELSREELHDIHGIMTDWVVERLKRHDKVLNLSCGAFGVLYTSPEEMEADWRKIK